MIKLYFKKLLSMLLYAGIWILVFFIGYGAFATAANFFKFNIVRYSILIGIPAIIILAIVYNHRKEKTEIKRFYLKSVTDKKMILIKEIRYMLTFPDFFS